MLVPVPLAVSLLLLCLSAPGLAAQRSAEAVRLADGERVRLDGLLDEALWQRIEPIDGFLQREPVEGGTPTERTEVRIAYDADNLYLGVVLHDSDPAGILGHQKQRDAGLGTDDRFMWILDTFRDGRTGYFFEINPAGLMGDGLLRTGGGVNKAWNGIWAVKVARGDWGWSAEIRIPFRTLNFDPNSERWGINFQRTVRRRNEEIIWSGHRRNQELSNPAHAGVLTGLRGLSQGLGLEVKPYAVASGRSVGPAGSAWDTPADVGFDASYSITPGLRASLSVNTDFAEAEVDQRRVNLTRFSLRFPEQRDFFLEGSGVFAFAPNNGVEPYFSRRIGLAGGTPVPVRYGARLTGQAGAYDLGLLQVRTGAAGALPGERFTVGRVVRNLYRQSSAGLIVTRRETDAAGPDSVALAAHTVGADLELYTSRFMGDRNLRFQAFYVLHDDPGVPGTPGSGWRDRSAHGLRLSYPNDLWSAHVSYRELGERFDPAVGFTPRRGFRRVQPSVQYAPRPAWLPSVRQLEFGARAEWLGDLSGRLQTGSLAATLLGARFRSGDGVSLEYEHSFEVIDFHFRLHPDTALGALVPAGDYDFGRWQLGGSTAGRRLLSGSASVSHGGFWSGGRTQYAGSLTARPRPGVSLSGGMERNELRLPAGGFATHVLSVGGGWHFTPALSLTSTAQYDDVSDLVGLNTRFRWIVRPGSDLFIVYGHNWRSLEERYQTQGRSATTKLTYTHRF
jgi:hypothetical protein